MRLPTSLRWVGLALLGLAIAAAIALAAGRLASQQIGIASESVSAGDSLAPPVTATHRRRHVAGGRASPGREERESATEGSSQAAQAEPEVTEEAGEGEAQTAPVEASESAESEPPATTSRSEPHPDDGGGGGAGKDGGGPDD